MKVGDMVTNISGRTTGIILGDGKDSGFEWMIFDLSENFIWFGDTYELELISEGW